MNKRELGQVQVTVASTSKWSGCADGL